jgi:hypothetical protein
MTKKDIAAQKFFFFEQKLQFTYHLASIKDAQATGEAFTLSSTSKKKFIYIILFLWVISALLYPDPIRIWIHNTG